MTKPYDKFLQAFQAGREKVEASRQAGSADLEDVAKASLTALSSTEYGRALTADSDLRRSLEILETDLFAWIRIIRDSDFAHDESLADGFDALDDEAEEAVRRFLYWGRLGQVIHRFRDGGLATDTSWERAVRSSIRDKADKLAQEIESLITDPTVQSVYVQGSLKLATRTIDNLRKLHTDFERTPYDIPEGTPPPFQNGDTIIRRQFLLACNLLAFELFGCVRPEVLERLLEVKSSTAENLGLRPWPIAATGETIKRGSRPRILRDYIKADIPLAKHKAKQCQWPTRPIIEYFAANQKARETVVRGQDDDC